MLIGIVGKPSCGKSTFFKAATLAEVAIASYPFTTIKPNEGAAFVRVDCAETFFKVKCNPREGYCINGQRFIPFRLMDVAGLVEGAHEGKGLGLQFLDDLRQADAFIHIIDASGSTNEKGEIVSAGTHDPLKDVAFLEHELDMWYTGILRKGWERFSRQVEQEHGDIIKALAKQLSGLNVNENHVKEAIKFLKFDEKKPASWTDIQLYSLSSFLRNKTKPMLIAANKCDIFSAKDNVKRLQEKFPLITVIPCAADSELALRSGTKKGLINYLPGDSNFNVTGSLSSQQTLALNAIKNNVFDNYGSTGVQRVLNEAVFSLLGRIPIFPGGINKLADSKGNILPDCFLLPPNSTALDFAFHIHTDLGNKFIRAIDVKRKQTIGKEYVLKIGDVVEIIANA